MVLRCKKRADTFSVLEMEVRRNFRNDRYPELDRLVGCHLYQQRLCVVLGRRVDNATIDQLGRVVACARELSDDVLLVGGREVLRRAEPTSASLRSLPSVWEDVIADIHRSSA